jgi:ABC-type multidrug transport system permease subunit
MQDVEIPWIALQISLLTLIAYFMIGFEADAAKFVFFWIAANLSCMSMAYLGMLVVCVTPNMQMGITAGATILVR